MLKQKVILSRISVLSLLVLILLTVGPLAAVASAKDSRELTNSQLILDGRSITLHSSLHTVNGRLYLPIALVASDLGASVQWNSSTQEATVMTKSNDEIILGDEVPTVYFNGQRYVLEDAPYMHSGRIFVPVRHIAEMLHAQLSWDAGSRTLTLQSVPLEIVSEDNTLADISNRNSLTQAQVVKRNGFSSKEQIETGMKLAVIIPSVLDQKAESYTDAEFNLLAKIVQVESGYESYEGQLAVANVILNRVKSSKFPGSIKDVIYSGKQFPPAHNGLLDRSKPNDSVLRATKDALNGKNNVADAVYFYNPRYSKGSFWNSLTTVATIGNHRFAK